MKKFIIEVFGLYQLDEKSIWPDGDGPENPTSEDVEKLIEEEYFNKSEWLSEWNLDVDIAVREI